jgi:hypothetical protein
VRAYWEQFVLFLDYGIEIRRLICSTDERPAAQSHPQPRPVPSGQAVLKVLYPPSELGRIPPPQRRDPQFGVEIGAAGVHDLLRGTNPDPMTVAMITYTAGRTLPRAAPREEIPVASAGNQSAIVVVAEGSDLDSNSACLPGSDTGPRAVLPGWRRRRAAGRVRRCGEGTLR